MVFNPLFIDAHWRASSSLAPMFHDSGSYVVRAAAVLGAGMGVRETQVSCAGASARSYRLALLLTSTVRRLRHNWTFPKPKP